MYNIECRAGAREVAAGRPLKPPPRQRGSSQAKWAGWQIPCKPRPGTRRGSSARCGRAESGGIEAAGHVVADASVSAAAVAGSTTCSIAGALIAGGGLRDSETTDSKSVGGSLWVIDELPMRLHLQPLQLLGGIFLIRRSTARVLSRTLVEQNLLSLASHLLGL